MSQTTFDWGAVVNAIQQALGTVIEAIATALQQNAAVIGSLLVGMAVVGIAWYTVSRYFPAVGRILGRLGL
jgi:Zn-dependent alcohol dehydrogenase